jgi:hypothetical protein
MVKPPPIMATVSHDTDTPRRQRCGTGQGESPVQITSAHITEPAALVYRERGTLLILRDGLTVNADVVVYLDGLLRPI